MPRVDGHPFLGVPLGGITKAVIGRRNYHAGAASVGFLGGKAVKLPASQPRPFGLYMVRGLCSQRTMGSPKIPGTDNTNARRGVRRMGNAIRQRLFFLPVPRGVAVVTPTTTLEYTLETPTKNNDMPSSSSITIHRNTVCATIPVARISETRKCNMMTSV